MSAQNLGDRLQQGLAAHRGKIEAHTRVLVEHGGAHLVAPMRERLATILSRIGAHLVELGASPLLSHLRFNAVVIGRFSTGKSTLLSGVAGSALMVNGIEGGLLPESDSPCTAIPTYLNAGSEQLAVYLVERPQAGSPVALRREISVAELKAMHLHPASGGSDPFPDISRIEIEGALPSEFENVTLIDTLGADDRPERTARTLEVAQSADAVIVVLRADMGSIATPDELAFLHKVAPPRAAGGKKVFFVVNEFATQRFSADEVDYLWTLLLTEQERGPAHTGQSLEEGDIFLVNAAAAKRGRLEGDSARLAASGLEAFEARLAGYLLTDGVKGKIQPVVGDLIEAGQELEEAVRAEIQRMRNRRIDAGVTADAVVEPLKEILGTLDSLHQEIQRTATSITGQIRRSFEAAMMSSVNDVSAALDAHNVDALKGWLGKLRHLVWKKTATEEVQKVLKETVESRMANWARNTFDATSPVRIFEAEQRALIEIIARRLAETEVILDNVRRELMGQEVEEGTEVIRSRIERWRSQLEVALRESIASHVESVDFGGEYFSAAFGAVVWGTLANIGLVPVAQAALVKIGLVTGLQTVFTGIAGTVALPITAAAAAAGALLMNLHADQRLKAKTIRDFSTRMQQTTSSAWALFEENLASTINGARDKFSREVAGVAEGARRELDCLFAEAEADLSRLQKRIEEREADAAALAAELREMRDLTDAGEAVHATAA